MLRGGHLSRMLVAKGESDRALFSTNKDSWYLIDSALLETEVRATFYPSHYDGDTEQFLEQSLTTSNSICLQLCYSMLSTLLSLILTKTSANGLMNRGGMFLLSRGQFKNFVGLPDDWSPVGKKLLDLGAGDGGITAVFSEFFMHVCATEASKVMEWRLAQRGFNVLPIDKWKNSGGPYNLISALNLLDRHYNPWELLYDIHQVASDSNSLVLLSLVLPLKHYVEFGNPSGEGGGSGRTSPESQLSVRGTKYEDHVNSLIRHTLQPAGFEVVRWTKVPYLCEGDLAQAYYKLDDAVFLLRPVPRQLMSSIPLSAPHPPQQQRREEI